ncbi:MAG: zinc-dependent alcohol dehydrogenase family protein [Chromatiales bacterium]|nr:MAG: zinc-dependent alcohol dehydrogenase family protein [Chromatiales bacterium]
MSGQMQAMVCPGPARALVMEQRPIPQPGPGQVQVRVLACAVCRTDLHVQDNELADIPYPVVPGHQVVGAVSARGSGVDMPLEQRVGIAWLAWACGECDYCTTGQENLCDHALFNGYQRDGGYAEFMVADADFVIPLSADLDPARTTPLLCGGLIGYRALRMAGDARRLGIYGFGSAAHMIAQVAQREGREVYAFTSPGDKAAQAFARELGAAWAGGSDEPAPEPLDGALIFAPVGALVPKALRDVRKGGRVVCGGIHMSDIPAFPYADLWGERQIRSVANLTRRDGREFMALAAAHPIDTQITRYSLAQANEALDALREGRINGTAVLDMTT